MNINKIAEEILSSVSVKKLATEIISSISVKPYMQNRAGFCGPAALRIVLDYYGIKKSEEELGKILHTTKELGTKEEDFKRVANEFGLKVEVKENSSLEDIKKWIDKDVPVIVDWFVQTKGGKNGDSVPGGHYSVVTDIDDKYIYLQDPTYKELRKIKQEDFLSVWFDYAGEELKKNQIGSKVMIVIYKDDDEKR